MTAVEILTDPAVVLARAGERLARDPVVSTVVATVTADCARDDAAGRPGPDRPRWWALALDDDGEVVGVGMRTAPFAPYPPYLLPMPDDAAVALARLLHGRGERVGGVNGARGPAEAFAAETARLVGGTVQVHQRSRLFEHARLDALVEPARPPGRLRRAEAADTDLCVAWFAAFHHDVDVAGGRPPAPDAGTQVSRDLVVDRIAAGCLWLWEDGGEAVHLTGTHLPAGGVVRVGPVYTPAAARGRGYAGATVAAVTRAALKAGHRACLATDLANPTSNRLYVALGYRPVVDTVSLLIG